jgi:hypothetical protein
MNVTPSVAKKNTTTENWNFFYLYAVYNRGRYSSIYVNLYNLLPGVFFFV